SCAGALAWSGVGLPSPRFGRRLCSMKAFPASDACLLALILSSVSSRAWPQTQTALTPDPTFEVASIKPNNSGNGGTSISAPAGGFTAINVTVRGLILNAYD